MSAEGKSTQIELKKNINVGMWVMTMKDRRIEEEHQCGDVWSEANKINDSSDEG